MISGVSTSGRTIISGLLARETGGGGSGEGGEGGGGGGGDGGGIAVEGSSREELSVPTQAVEVVVVTLGIGGVVQVCVWTDVCFGTCTVGGCVAAVSLAKTESSVTWLSFLPKWLRAQADAMEKFLLQSFWASCKKICRLLSKLAS